MESSRFVSLSLSRRKSSNCPCWWTPSLLPLCRCALFKGNPRRPITPDVAHTAQWWPRESSGWPRRTRGRAAPEWRKTRNTAGPTGLEWCPTHGLLRERASASSMGPNLGHTALRKKVPSTVEGVKDCHPVPEILWLKPWTLPSNRVGPILGRQHNQTPHLWSDTNMWSATSG